MESVWSYPARPAFEAESRLVRVELAGEVVAETREAIRLLERGLPPSFYIPPRDTRTDLLERCDATSLCPVKGEARYWAIRVADRLVDRAAWSYPEPLAMAASIGGYFAFDANKADRCLIGDRVARGRNHTFYGGWITDDLEGPFVGDPGLPDELAARLPRPVLSDDPSDSFEDLAALSFVVGRHYLPPDA